MFNKKIFSQRLKELRISQKLTLEQLGQELGVIKQTVGHWESGIRMPSLEVATALADYFNVSLDYLVGRTDNPEVRKDD